MNGIKPVNMINNIVLLQNCVYSPQKNINFKTKSVPIDRKNYAYCNSIIISQISTNNQTILNDLNFDRHHNKLKV